MLFRSVCFNTDATGTNGYRLVFQTTHAGVQLQRNRVVVGSYAISWTNGVWYWLKLFDAGSYLLWYVWPEGTPQPDGSSYSSAYDSTPLAVTQAALDGGAGACRASFDDVYVMTNSMTDFAYLPTPPSQLGAAAVATDQIKLTWLNNANTNGFSAYQVIRIARATDAAFTANLATIVLAPGTTDFTDGNLVFGLTYYYRLCASNSIFGNGPNSGVVNVHLITAQQSWESRYGVAADASDPFGRGFNNLTSFLAGFNPTNEAAYLHIIGIGKTNGADLVITYLGANGDNSYEGGPLMLTNILEVAPSLAGGGFSNAFLVRSLTNILGGGNGLGVVTNAVDVGGGAGAPARFYRIRVLVP